jgi:hypothetical protein
MLFTLAFRHLWVRRLRSLFLLLGFSIGVGVMIVLLSVGEAMLDQSRDVSLVGGGQVTVLPQGIDVEAMRTGGLGGMFFGIDRARYLTRQVLGGPREAARVRTVSPAIEGKLPVSARCRGRVARRRSGPEATSPVGRGRSEPVSICVKAPGETRQPIHCGSHPPASSSTTSSTGSTSLAGPTAPGQSGTIST